MHTVLAVCAYEQRHYSAKGVKDHSLHIFGRQHNLLLSAAWNSQGVAHTHTLRRKSGRRKAVEGRTRVIGFLAYHTRRSSARAWRRTVHVVVIFTVSF